MRSTCCGLEGCAAGHKSRPSVVGIARALDEVQERSVIGAAGGGYAVPSGQAVVEAHWPEQAADFRPAELP